MSENEDPQEINAASPLKQWFGGFAGALFAFFALFVVAHILYCFFHWGGDENAAIVSDWVSDVIYFGPFVFAWRTYRHKALSQRTRVAWLLISLAHFAFFVGNALWTYFELALNESPFPSWADAGYLAYYPFMLAGMVYIVDKMTSKEERVGFVLDSAIILIGGGLVIWYLLLVPIAQAADDDTLKTVLSLAYPIGDIVLLLGIASIALRRRGFKLSSPIPLLLFGVVLNFIADIYFGYNNLQGVYKTGDPTDALYSVGLFPVILAAHYQYILATRGDIDQESTAPLMARRSSPWLTYIAVAAAYCVLITMGVTGFEFIPGVDIMMGALLSALLLVRQLIFIREKNNADAAVTKLQERIQGIYAAATDGIAVSGIDGRLLEFNDAFARMLGYDRCELLDGIGVSDVTAPESAQATIDARETALGSDKPVEYEKEYVRKDGSRFDASVTVFPVGGSNEQQAVAAIVHDITERKQTELRLRAAEERSQLALRINRDGIWDWDIPNKKYYYSPIWRELFGYSSDEAIDILPANSEEFFHPDDRHLSYELRDAIDRGQRNFDIEFRHRCKDGRYKWVRCRAEAMVDPSTGRLTRLIGLNTDIEEKKRAELEREVIGSILQGVSVTENLEDLLALIHCEIGRVIYADNCFVALYDKGSRLFKMQFFVDKFDEVPRASALEGTRSHYVFSTGQPLFLDSQNTRDYERQGAFHLVGSPPKFWLGTPLRTPSEVIGVLVVQSYDDDHTFTKRDLDFLTSVAGTVALAIQRKQTESRMLLQTVALESAANGVVITDNNGTIEWVNPAFTRLTGYSFEESVGNKPRMLKSGRTTANVYARLWNTITKGDVWQGELVNRRKDGSLYDEEMTITPVVGTDGKIDHFIAIKRDITERKVAEQQLMVFNEKLQRSNRELQDFAYVASHDLQEPLRKVQTFADRLGSKYAASLDGTGLDYLERMRNAASRMQTLIQDLLSFSRVTTKAQPFVPVDLEQVTREVMSDLEVKIEETGALIETSGLPKVEADPLQMRQLIQNLVGNALKFRRKDVALLVKITGEKASLSAGNGNGNGAYRITVEDNGIGFDDKYTEKIFTVFQRLHGRTEYEGSGIGLAVCRKIVERHHGNITAHGRPGHGAQFIFTLPGHQQNTEVTH